MQTSTKAGGGGGLSDRDETEIAEAREQQLAERAEEARRRAARADADAYRAEVAIGVHRPPRHNGREAFRRLVATQRRTTVDVVIEDQDVTRPPPVEMAPGTPVKRAIIEMAVDSIDPSPTNPRKRFPEAAMLELMQSILEHGVLEPVWLRTKEGGRYEIIFGERRVRATRRAGLVTIPAEVHDEVSIERIVVLQGVENLQRTDVHPLEEADGFEQMREIGGLSVDEIVQATGKTRAYVYGSLKLTKLTKKPREAFLDGKIDKESAILIGRVPSKPLQEKFMAEITRPRWNGDEGMSFRDAQNLFQERYLQRLDLAPFDVSDAQLVPAAGACTDCPKGAGRGAEEKRELGKEDVCSDRDCFRSKLDADWAGVVKRAADTSGRIQVLDERDAAKLWHEAGGFKLEGPFVNVDDRPHEDAKRRTYRDILGEDVYPITLARDPDGFPVQLVEKKRARGAMIAGGIVSLTGAPASEKKARDDHRRKSQLRQRTNDLVVNAVIEKLAADDDRRSPTFWRQFAEALLNFARHDELLQVVRRHGWKRQQGAWVADSIKKWISTMNHADLRDLCLEVVLVHGLAFSHGTGLPATLATVARSYGIDRSRFESIARGELEEKKKPAPTKAAAPATPAALPASSKAKPPAKKKPKSKKPAPTKKSHTNGAAKPSRKKGK